MSQPIEKGPQPSSSRPDVQPAGTRPSSASGHPRQPPPFYSPPPTPTGPPAARPGIGKTGVIAARVLATLVVALAMEIGLAMRSPPPSPPPPAVTVAPVVNDNANLPSKKLVVSAADRDDKATEQLKGILRAGVASANMAAVLN